MSLFSSKNYTSLFNVFTISVMSESAILSYKTSFYTKLTKSTSFSVESEKYFIIFKRASDSSAPIIPTDLPVSYFIILSDLSISPISFLLEFKSD